LQGNWSHKAGVLKQRPLLTAFTPQQASTVPRVDY
jgi:hypothetical protein